MNAITGAGLGMLAGGALSNLADIDGGAGLGVLGAGGVLGAAVPLLFFKKNVPDAQKSLLEIAKTQAARGADLMSQAPYVRQTISKLPYPLWLYPTIGLSAGLFGTGLATDNKFLKSYGIPIGFAAGGLLNGYMYKKIPKPTLELKMP